jgi:hypothetical protein
MKSHNSQVLWTELTETQSEVVNGGAIVFNTSFFSKITDQINTAIVLNSGNAIGAANSAGVAVFQSNQA